MKEPVTLESEKEAPEDKPDPLVIRMPVDVRSLSLSILGGLALLLAMQYAQSVLIPIVLGLLLSYALSPMVGVARSAITFRASSAQQSRWPACRQPGPRRLHAERRSHGDRRQRP